MKKVTDETLMSFVEKHDNVVLDVYAEWCSPCKPVAKHLKKLEKEMPDITFAKMDVDDNKLPSEHFKVFGVPTIIIFKGGEALGSFGAGNMGIDKLRKEIRRQF
tara:strand:+ start:13427 stop:13738 length:312 start_codon:yes stop_codon:yes gene_type:complete